MPVYHNHEETGIARSAWWVGCQIGTCDQQGRAFVTMQNELEVSASLSRGVDAFRGLELSEQHNLALVLRATDGASEEKKSTVQ